MCISNAAKSVGSIDYFMSCSLFYGSTSFGRNPFVRQTFGHNVLYTQRRGHAKNCVGQMTVSRISAANYFWLKDVEHFSNCLYFKNMMIINDDCHEWSLYDKCSPGAYDTSRVIRMTIIGDATTWSITYNCHSDNSIGVIYDGNIFIIHHHLWLSFWWLYGVIYDRNIL